jgi:hypothetical protein
MKLAFVIRLQFARDAATKPGLPQFRSIEMATLEQGNGQFKQPSLTCVECEFRSALRHWTGGFEPILNYYGRQQRFSPERRPKPHTWDMSRTNTERDRPLGNYKGDRTGISSAGLALVFVELGRHLAGRSRICR